MNMTYIFQIRAKAAVDIIVHEFVDIEYYRPKRNKHMKKILVLGAFLILVTDLECSDVGSLCSYGSGKLNTPTTQLKQ